MNVYVSSGLAYKVYSLAQTEKLAGDYGFDGLEIVLPPSTETNQSQRDVSYTTLQKIPAIHARGGFYDRKTFIAALDEAVRIAEDLSCPLVNIHPPALAFGGRQNVLEGIQAIKKKEERTSVVIAYEVLANPGNARAEARDQLKRQQAHTSVEDWIADVLEFDLAATLDTAHLGTWGVKPEDYIEPLGNNLKHVHLSGFDIDKKTEHLLPDEGTLNLHPFMQRIAKTHPNISVTCEIMPIQTTTQVHDALQRMQTFLKPYCV